MANSDNESAVTLRLLNAVEENSAITQRGAAKKLGIALGLTNTYLKRCVKKGLIKIQQAPANRYAYYLTPNGFAEKSRLTAEYLSQGFHFFRLARNQCIDIYQLCEQRKWHNIALHGLTDLTEIAVLCSIDFDIRIVGIISKSSSLEEYAGHKIVSDLSELDDFDAILINDLGSPQASFNYLSELVSADRILTPAILNISRLEISQDIEK